MYLLDTHAVVWASISPDLLSERAREAVDSKRIKVSVASLWELLIKKNRKGAPVADPLEWWERNIVRASIEVLAIRTRHLAMLDKLPEFHRDPFDRILIAQALEEQLTIVTADAAIARYDIPTIWH